MDLIRETSAIAYDQDRVVTPKVILNADAHDDKTITKRGGKRRIIEMSDCHSVGGETKLFFVSNGYLYVLDSKLLELAYVGDYRTSYVEHGNKVYISNKSWCGVYDMNDKTIKKWGFDLPPAPKFKLIEGNLPAGVYHLCYTYFRDGLIGGNGQISSVYRDEPFGIELIDIPEDVICWITDTNTGDFYQASFKITEPYHNRPLPSFEVIKPKPMESIVQAFGRIWGIRDRKLVYSEPFVYEWFKEFNYFQFDDDIHMVAPYVNGLYVNSLNKTYLLEETDVAKMTMRVIGKGALKGSLTYGSINLEGINKSTPIWISKEGVIIGIEGSLINITESIIEFHSSNEGALVCRNMKGKKQMLISVDGGNKIIDYALRYGKIYIPKVTSITGDVAITVN